MEETESTLRRVVTTLKVLLVGGMWMSAALALWRWRVGSVGGDVVVIFCAVALTLHIFFRVWPVPSS